MLPSVLFVYCDVKPSGLRTEIPATPRQAWLASQILPGNRSPRHCALRFRKRQPLLPIRDWSAVPVESGYAARALEPGESGDSAATGVRAPVASRALGSVAYLDQP